MPRFPRVSTTVESLSAGVYSASRIASKARAMGDEVYRLHVGDTYLEPPECARAEAQKVADHPRLHNYSPVQGEPVLRKAILAEHAGAIDRENLQVTGGATPALAVVCRCLVNEGDEVIILAPYWPLIRGVVASFGGVPVEVPFWDRLDGLDVEATLRAAVTERTAAIYVNTPHNPTGRVLPAAAINAIAEVAERHDLWVMSDEAYEYLYFTKEPPPKVWKHPKLQKRSLVVHTFSKSFGLAGARVGYIHGPSEAMAAIRGTQTFFTYCASRPMQIGAARALTEAKDWVERARGLYADAGRKAAEALGLPVPEGGTFLFFDVSEYLAAGESVEDFLERCLDAGVLLTPGRVSGQDYESFVRMCFTVIPPDELDDAVARLRRVMGR